MIIEETFDGEKHHDDKLSKGVVIFPENEKDLKVIELLLVNTEFFKQYLDGLVK